MPLNETSNETPSETLDQTFESLMSGVLDGSTDAASNEVLNKLLRRHPEKQKDYLELMQLHGLLIWREGRVRAPATVTVTMDERTLLSPQPTTAAAMPSPQGVRPWRVRVTRAVAVLCCGILLGLVTRLMLWSSHERDNGPEVVEQLVAWNLDIAQASTRDERVAIYDTRSASMQGLVTNAALSQDDRDLAQSLVETSAWLTRNDDPMAEAERFGEIADKLLAQIDSATSTNDNPRMTKLADSYRKVTEVGVSVNLDRALAKNPADPKHRPKLDHLIAGDAGRAKQLEDMLEKHPDPASKAIHRALKGHRRKVTPGFKP